MQRRSFIKKSFLGAVSSVILPVPKLIARSGREKLKFGIISDTHPDMLPDSRRRLRKFIQAAIKHEAEFIIQLGDFCHPRPQEKDFLDIWNSFPGARYHVLGNHDMDFAGKGQTMKFWAMPSNYYSFDRGGFHFVVLDANYLYRDGAYQDYARANFYVADEQRAHIPPEQIDWLKADLQATAKPTIIFSHQSLINPCWGIKNRIRLQQLFEEINRQAGFRKVVLCFNGHDHIDFQRRINGIHYVEINSAAYQWLGEKYSCYDRYPKPVYEKFSHLHKVAPYKDALYALVTITDRVTVKGVQSSWLGPSPAELGQPDQVYGCRYSPLISDLNIELQSP